MVRDTSATMEGTMKGQTFFKWGLQRVCCHVTKRSCLTDLDRAPGQEQLELQLTPTVGATFTNSTMTSWLSPWGVATLSSKPHMTLSWKAPCSSCSWSPGAHAPCADGMGGWPQCGAKFPHQPFAMMSTHQVGQAKIVFAWSITFCWDK